MSAVADIFDRDGDGYIDYYEFVAALHPNKDAYKPLTDADKIEDEVGSDFFHSRVLNLNAINTFFKCSLFHFDLCPSTCTGDSSSGEMQMP